MPTILITGGTGTLGRDLVARLQSTDHTVRIMSRQPAPPVLAARTEWATADLATGAGLDDAVRGVNIIINAASDPGGDTHQADVVGLKALLDAAHRHHVSHILHISIVGIDRMAFGYYQHKLGAESVIAESDVSYSIVRITQFHSLVLDMLKPLLKTPDLPLRIPTDMQLQSIDSGDAAAYVLENIHSPANDRLPDAGGPEVLTLGEMAQTLLAARGDSRPIEHTLTPDRKLFWPSPQVIEAYRHGFNTTPDNRYGKITWRDYINTPSG